MHVLARWGLQGRIFAFMVAVAATGIAASTSAASGAPPPLSAAEIKATAVSVTSVIKAAKAAINAETSAHVVFDASGSSSTAENIVGDVGTRGGTETVNDGAAVLSVTVTPTASYISGTPTGLTTLFGLTSAEATKVGARWEFWKEGSAQYKSLMNVVSVHSLQSLLPKAKGTTLATTATTYTLTWRTKATSREPALSNTLTISATKGAKLPIAETSSDAAGENVTTTLSKWDEKLHIKAPPSSSTISATAVSG